MTSKFMGVRAERGQWRADIQINGKKKFLGYHKTELLAAKAYNDAISKYGLTNRTPNTLTAQVATPVTAGKVGGRVAPSNPSPTPNYSLTAAINTLTPQISLTVPVVTLKEAVEKVITIYVRHRYKFTAHDITSAIREAVNTAEFRLAHVPMERVDVNGTSQWSQKIEHDDVRQLVVAIFNDKKIMAGYKSTNVGKFIQYSM